MKRSTIFWLVFLGAGSLIGSGDLIYELGRDSVQRECPPSQSGQMILNSEQRKDSMVCVYASEESSYGLVREVRRP